MMRYLLDTNVVHALLNRRDAHHTKALAWLRERLATDAILVPTIVVAELLIASKDPTSVIAYCNRLCSRQPLVQAEEHSFISAIPIQKRKTLKVVDCCIVALSFTHNATLVTYDKKLHRFWQSCVSEL